MSGHAARSPGRRRAFWLGTSLVLAITVAGTYWVGGRGSATAAAPAAAGFVRDRDVTDGFQIDHPSNWRTTAVPGGVLMAVSGQDAVTVKRTELAAPVDASNLADLRAVTDAVLTSAPAHLGILKAEATSLDGLPAVYYLYTFGSGAQRGGAVSGIGGHNAAMAVLESD